MIDNIAEQGLIPDIICKFNNTVLSPDDSVKYLDIFYDVNTKFYVMHGVFVNNATKAPFHVASWGLVLSINGDLYNDFCRVYFERRDNPEWERKIEDRTVRGEEYIGNHNFGADVVGANAAANNANNEQAQQQLQPGQRWQHWVAGDFNVVQPAEQAEAAQDVPVDMPVFEEERPRPIRPRPRLRVPVAAEFDVNGNDR